MYFSVPSSLFCTFDQIGANNNVEIALESCMTQSELIVVEELLKAAEYAEVTLTVDALYHLLNSKVFLFSGSKDTTVEPGVVHKVGNRRSKDGYHVRMARMTNGCHRVMSNRATFFSKLLQVKDFYKRITVGKVDIKTVFDVPAEHSMVTESIGNDCDYLVCCFVFRARLIYSGVTIYQQMWLQSSR